MANVCLPARAESELARTWLGDRQLRQNLKSLVDTFQLLKVGLQRWLRFACTAIGVEEVRQVRSRDCRPILRGRARRRSQGFLWLPMLQLSADQVLKRLQPSVASSFPFSALAAYWRHAFAIFNKVSRCSGGPFALSARTPRRIFGIPRASASNHVHGCSPNLVMATSRKPPEFHNQNFGFEGSDRNSR